MQNLLIEPTKTGYLVRTMDSPIKTAEGISLAIALIEFLSEHCGFYPIVKEKEKEQEKVEGKAA